MMIIRMLPKPDHVFVYQYVYWDSEARERKTSAWYATEPVIRRTPGMLMPETRIEVPACEVDEDGHHLRSTESEPE